MNLTVFNSKTFNFSNFYSVRSIFSQDKGFFDWLAVKSVVLGEDPNVTGDAAAAEGCLSNNFFEDADWGKIILLVLLFIRVAWAWTPPALMTFLEDEGVSVLGLEVLRLLAGDRDEGEVILLAGECVEEVEFKPNTFLGVEVLLSYLLLGVSAGLIVFNGIFFN